MKLFEMDICGVEYDDGLSFISAAADPGSNPGLATLKSFVNEPLTFDCKWFLFVECRCVRLCTFFIVFRFLNIKPDPKFYFKSIKLYIIQPHINIAY